MPKTITLSTTRTSSGLKDALFDELDNLRNGKSTPQHARAVSGLINNVIATTRLEMDYASSLTKHAIPPTRSNLPSVKLT